MAAKSEDDEPRHDEEISETSRADKYRRWPIGNQPTKWSSPIRLTQRRNVFSGNLRIEKSVPENRLHDTQGDDHEHESKIDVEKALKCGFRIDERISDNHERHVTKIELHAKQTIRHAGRRGVKHLHRAEPHKDQQNDQERRPKDLHVLAFAPICHKER